MKPKIEYEIFWQDILEVQLLINISEHTIRYRGMWNHEKMKIYAGKMCNTGISRIAEK